MAVVTVMLMSVEDEKFCGPALVRATEQNIQPNVEQWACGFAATNVNIYCGDLNRMFIRENKVNYLFWSQ